ncbi:MAG: efflux RND transporter permease subunit [Planctomycetaceae bacterium]|jgi:HAE1 family hydrophobic/amphiphilic exporter-1|nr:efflux RND transporter permease subunit [Planctomycetaceae bacterium]
MDIIKFSIRNPIKTAVGVLLTVLFGILALVTVPIQLTPDVERPVISIRTAWQGRSPEEVETSILFEQEEKLKSIQGLYRMTSTASLGRGDIELEFNVGYDMGRATQEVSNHLNEVRNYPEDVERPVIRTSSSQTDEAIAYIIIQSANNPNFDVAEFYDYADHYIKPQLERIPGLSEIDIYGSREHEIQVRFNPVALAQNGITIQEFQNAIRADNINDSAGDLSGGRTDYRFRVVGRFDTLEPLRNGIIKYVNGVPVYVKDVADINMVLKKSTYFNQSKGQSSMIFAFKRETGANVLTVIHAIKNVLKELDSANGPFAQYKNDRYKIRPRLAYDDSMYIDKAIALVRRNLYEGSILAVLILLIFLRSVRPTLIIALSIPISILGTFVVLYVAGRNINVISMAGLTFAVGMVVDDAIVVLENIDRHLNMGKTPFQASYEGAREVWGAVLSATLTTAAVFAPIFTIQEEAGQLYYDIGIAISAAILFSLLVSITVIPMLAVKMLKPKNELASGLVPAGGITPAANKYGLYGLFGLAALCNRLNEGFAKFLHTIMIPNWAGIWTRLLFSAVITAASLYLCYVMMPPASYLPNGNKNYISSVVNTPPATSYRQNVYMGRVLQDSLRPYWEAKTRDDIKDLPPVIDIRTGKEIKDIAPIRETWAVFTASGMRVMAMSADNQNVRTLVSLLNAKINQLPGITGMATQNSLFGRRSAGNQLQIELTGNDMIRLRDSTAYFQKHLIGIFSQAGVRTNPSNYNQNGPEFQLVIDQPKAKELGIGLEQIGVMVRSLIDGTYSGDYDFEGDNIDLYVIRDPDIPLTPYNVADLPVAVKGANNSEMIIPLSEIVKFNRSEASQEIRRYEQQRAIQIQISPPDEMPLETVQNIVYKAFDECKAEGGITPDIRIILAGSADKLTQTRQAMLGKWTGFNGESVYSLLTSRFFLALLIVYLLMSALFESFLYPFVIMFSVPLAMTGGILGLAFVNYLDPTQQMDTLAMLGFIILIGIVVRNAILIVHQSLNFIRGYGESKEEVLEKLPYREAICESVRTRMRPIFMTSLASIFGMLPLVIYPGEGSELYRGLGAVVLGGLACSTVFTLFLVPMLFSLVLDLQMKFGKKLDA